MKCPERWRPTKFVMDGRRLRASSDPTKVAPGSRFITGLIAQHYQRLIEEHARGRLLDLGAGAAPLYEAYREFVESVICVDWYESAHSGEHIDVFADLNVGLPIADGSFDTVLLTDVLEHVYQPHLLFREVSRVLAPGGKLLVGVPFFYWIHEAPHDYARYTAFMLRRLCDDNGLTVRAIDATGGSIEVALDMIGKHLGWAPSLANAHSRFAQWMVRLPGIAAISRHTARWFPQGYVLVAQKSERKLASS